MILCIAEKPAMGRDIARIVGADIPRQGYFEGNGYWVTWTYGHLCTLKEPADYSPLWRNWSIGALPMIPPQFGIKIIDAEHIKRQFEVIRHLMAECDMVINCGDAGQEGELIQRWVMQKAGCKKPVKRLWVSSLTDESIREGFAHLREHADLEPLYLAGLCRAIGDWILGINATRLYSLKYGSSNSPGKRAVLSVGRVQTPTLAIIVKRQKEIDEFVPIDSWEVKTLYRDVLFSSMLKPFDSEEKAMKVVESIRGEEFSVSDVGKKSGREAPPRLFDLTSLQVECNKKFGFSADETLQYIQSLYEKKLTTYPRVDTTYLTDDVYPKCEGILRGLSPYAKLTAPLLAKSLKKSKKVFDNSKVTDHHAIIPTGQPLPSGLPVNEKRVLHIIIQRFIASFYPDMLFEQTIVKGKTGKVEFKATGKVVTDPGWKKVYETAGSAAAIPENENAGEDEGVLPPFTPGEKGPHEPRCVKKTSQPPKYFTEGTLLKAMETAGSMVEDETLREALKANGIGRPSTRSAIIETLYKRGYIRKAGKSLRATDAGIELIGLIKEELLKSPELTGIWEGRLRSIERGEYSPKEFIDHQKEMITQITLAVLQDTSNRRIVTVANDVTEKKEKSGKPKGKGGNKKGKEVKETE